MTLSAGTKNKEGGFSVYEDRRCNFRVTGRNGLGGKLGRIQRSRPHGAVLLLNLLLKLMVHLGYSYSFSIREVRPMLNFCRSSKTWAHFILPLLAATDRHRSVHSPAREPPGKVLVLDSRSESPRSLRLRLPASPFSRLPPNAQNATLKHDSSSPWLE